MYTDCTQYSDSVGTVIYMKYTYDEVYPQFSNLDTFEHLKLWIVDLMCPPLVEIDVDNVKNTMDAIENAHLK